MTKFFIDPVCAKKVLKKKEFAIIKRKGVAYHLCCAACKSLFESKPNVYIKNFKLS